MGKEDTASELAAALNAMRTGQDVELDDGDFPVESTQVLDPKQQEELMSLRAQQSKKLSRADKHIVVMFTDLVGSTQYYERYGDLKGREKVLTHNALLFPIVQQNAGVIVKTIGDAIMCYFENETDALRAATRMQQTLSAYNQGISSADEQIHIRIALNAGVAIAQQGDIYGDVVNVAARIEHQAQADEILMAKSVCEPVKASWPIESAGSATFKGKAEPVELFRLRWRDVAGTDARQKMIALPKHFEVQKQLARSASGDLYLVDDKKRGGKAVVKRLYDFLGDDAEARAAFVEAAKEQASLEIDGVVRTFEHSQKDDLPAYYAIEWIEGPSLQRLVSKKGLPKPEDAVAILQRVAVVVKEANAKGVVHRNLDPSNIIVRADGKVMLNNFGMARVSAVGVKRGNSPVGTTAFTSPEAVVGGTVSAMSDVYSLGALLYFLLSGREPIEDAQSVQGTMVAAQGAIVPLKRVQPNVPDLLVSIIARSMGVLPRMRHADAQALLTDLLRFAPTPRAEIPYLRPPPATLPTGANPVMPEPPKPEPTRTEPTRTEPTRTEPTRTEQPKTEPHKIIEAPQPKQQTNAHATIPLPRKPDNPWLRPPVLGAVAALVFVCGMTVGVLLGLAKDTGHRPPQIDDRPPATAIVPPVQKPEPPNPLTARLEAAGVIALGDAYVVLEKGRTVTAWKDRGAPDAVDLGRLSANVAAFALGRLIDKGKVKSLSEPLSAFFPEWAQGKKRLVTVRHLLEHSSGMRAPLPDDAMHPPSVIRFALAGDVVDDPGSKQAFNAKAFNLLSGVVQAASGKAIDRFVAEEIAVPLGLSEPRWSFDTEHVPIASGGVAWSATDLAKLGAAFMDGGPAAGDQARLFSDAWFLAASTPSIADEKVSLLFRRNEVDGLGTVLFADDTKGSFWLLVPAKGVVAVRLSRTELKEGRAALPATINALFGTAVTPKQLGLPALTTTPAPASQPTKL